MKSGNDPTFVSATEVTLPNQVASVLAQRDDPTFDPKFVRSLAYRPLDRRFLYNDLPLLNRPGPEMQRAWGAKNTGLYTMSLGVGAGPAVWCHGLLPDYHSFSVRGGYAFPMHDRRAGPEVSNLNPVLVSALNEAYGAVQTPEDVFDAMLCLLSAQSYTSRFAEDLEDVFPHIPFPADPTIFAQCAEIGRAIRSVEAFEREPAQMFRPKAFCKLATEPDGMVASVRFCDGQIDLCGNGSGSITGIPEEVWNFAVSGYRVLPRWIEGRKGLPATLSLTRELRDVAARIAELIDWFGKADLVLDATLIDTLSREELGFAAPVAQATKEDDD